MYLTSLNFRTNWRASLRGRVHDFLCRFYQGWGGGQGESLLETKTLLSHAVFHILDFVLGYVSALIQKP